MGLFTPDINSLRELYTAALERQLNSERQIVDALPKMIEKSTSTELANAFRTHLEETEEHVSRLQRILDSDTGEANDTKCKITATLISGAESEIKDAKNEGVRDVVLAAAGNKVEHHEIAVYGTLVAWAKALGENDDVTLLEKTLQEEKRADALLSSIAAEINVHAPAVAAVA